MPTPPAKANRLARETSPYLLQHQFNPVDWFAWGDEAFAEARKRNVPIFLSVGYSTCYWCHVMERESFENEAVAAKMNAGFVCVKVDREERPDVDDIYMAAVQAFTQRGGWPMSVFLEPATLKPFWAGTYFPAEARRGMGNMPTFPQILDSISAAWRDRHAEIVKQADTLADAVRERVGASAAPVRIGEAQITQGASQLLRIHDSIHGGFGGAPKFPQPSFLDLLLAVRQSAGDDDTRRAIEGALNTTLAGMARGGIFDQVGGGFHRYSVDEKWLVPHFEKMLYDNGALAETYARASKSLGSALFARTARRICEYILREMTAPPTPPTTPTTGGAFYSAQDAEVSHREGQNYLWTKKQIVEVLGEKDGAWVASVYGLDAGTNFQDPHHPEDAPANVLFLSGDPDWTRLDALNARLYEARAKRDQPSTDTKILAGWNGLMIAGLAVTGRMLGEARFIDAARRAADFILGSMRTPDGSLLRTFAGGRAAIPAFLEDYALLAHGLLELHLTGTDSIGTYLHAAEGLVAKAEGLFADGRGGWYDTLADRPDLFVRTRTIHDGAMASGTSVMIHDLIDLAVITGNADLRKRAARGLASVSGEIAAHPLGAANSVRALLRLLALDRGAMESAMAGAEDPPRSVGGPGGGGGVGVLSAGGCVGGSAPGGGGEVWKMRVASGYHLAAADPGEGVVGLTPLSVRIVNGSGVSVYADYPKGELYGDPDRILVYRGEFDLPIVLERSGAWKGTPLIAVTYQACTDSACLSAKTVELDVSVERGG